MLTQSLLESLFATESEFSTNGCNKCEKDLCWNEKKQTSFCLYLWVQQNADCVVYIQWLTNSSTDWKFFVSQAYSHVIINCLKSNNVNEQMRKNAPGRLKNTCACVKHTF